MASNCIFTRARIYLAQKLSKPDIFMAGTLIGLGVEIFKFNNQRACGWALVAFMISVLWKTIRVK